MAEIVSENNKYSELVQVLLEKEYKLRLHSGFAAVKRKSEKPTFTLVDERKHFYIDIYPDIMDLDTEGNEILENVTSKINFLFDYYKAFEIRYILVFRNEITREFRSLFTSKLAFGRMERHAFATLLDKVDILNLAASHTIDASEYVAFSEEELLGETKSASENIKRKAKPKGKFERNTSDFEAATKRSSREQTSSFASESTKAFSEEPAEETPEEKDTTGSDKIPFHLDLVDDVDRLNREPIAKSLTRLLNNQIFKTKINNEGEEKSNFAFMVHLQGAWGDGKSTFLNLIEKNLDSKENKWIVIHFNAWQNQHITPPWWPFLDQIYRQAFRKIPWYKKPYLWIKERLRRLIKYRGFSRFIIILLVIIFSVSILIFQEQVFHFLMQLGLFTNTENEASLKTVFDTIVAISSVIGLFYTLASFLSKPFFVSSPEAAKTFLEKAADPMQKIKNHFQSLIKDIDTCGFKTAIFIDDLDRCNDKFTVELLEGIQTLFRDKQVLYVVAGDKHWISTCFENHYQNYNAVVKEPTQKLGYLFLEKAFQLTLRLPNVSGDIKKGYWEYILQINPNKESKVESINPERKASIIQEIQKEYKTADYSSPSVVKEFKEKYDLNEEDATDITLEILDKDNQDVHHVLQEHFDLLDTNPRGIKRLANQYNIYRNILIAEGKSFNRDKLFRWIILQNKYPVFTDWIEHNLHVISGDIMDDEKWNEGITNDSLWKKLVHDQNNSKGGKLVVDDIKVFSGLQNG
jgi:hypothetical protein